MKTLFACFLFTPFVLTAQIESEEIEQKSSNIQTYTPSKLLWKGQWDIKWFALQGNVFHDLAGIRLPGQALKNIFKTNNACLR